VPPGEWEGEDIVGEEIIPGERYYMVVVWKPTLEPEANLTNMGELIAQWKSKGPGFGQETRAIWD